MIIEDPQDPLASRFLISFSISVPRSIHFENPLSAYNCGRMIGQLINSILNYSWILERKPNFVDVREYLNNRLT